MTLPSLQVVDYFTLVLNSAILLVRSDDRAEALVPGSITMPGRLFLELESFLPKKLVLP